MNTEIAERTIKAANLILNGIPTKQVAKEMGISESTLRDDINTRLPDLDQALFKSTKDKLRENSKSPSTNTFTDEKKMKARNFAHFILEEHTVLETAKEFNSNRGTVRRTLDRVLSVIDPELYERVNEQIRQNGVNKSQKGANVTKDIAKKKFEKILATNQKACCRCKNVKDLSLFTTSNATPDKKAKRCSECDREMYLKNRDPLKPFQTKWDSVEKVLNAVKEKIEEGFTLTEISRNSAYLLQALYQKDLNLKKAIELIGYDYEELRVTQGKTHEELKEEIIAVQQEHGEISYRLLRDHYRALEGSLRTRFGNIENAIKRLDLEEKVTYVVYSRAWDVDSSLKHLEAIANKGLPLNYRNMYEYDSGFLTSLIRHHGQYEKALKKIGIDYSSIKEERSLTSAVGLEFEKLGLEILNRCDFNLKEGKYIQTPDSYILPDGVTEDGKTFIDFKLSSWTVFNSSTIQKYMPYCENLLIIYLRGDRINKDLPDEVEMIPISDIINENNLTDKYEEKLNNLLEKLKGESIETAS